jgi:hypothetical protein
VHEFVLRDTLFHYFPASGNFRGREREREREKGGGERKWIFRVYTQDLLF